MKCENDCLHLCSNLFILTAIYVREVQLQMRGKDVGTKYL